MLSVFLDLQEKREAREDRTRGSTDLFDPTRHERSDRRKVIRSLGALFGEEVAQLFKEDLLDACQFWKRREDAFEGLFVEELMRSSHFALERLIKESEGRVETLAKGLFGGLELLDDAPATRHLLGRASDLDLGLGLVATEDGGEGRGSLDDTIIFLLSGCQRTRNGGR